MKRSLFVLAAFALIFSSCAAGTKARPKIGVAMPSFDDAVSVAIRRSIETAALDKADLAIIDGQDQQSTQNLQAASFFERKLGAVAIGPVDSSALGYLIGEAKAARTPIVFFDRQPSDTEMRSWDKLFFVGTRAADAGEAQGEILAAYWKAEPSSNRNKAGTAHFISLDADRKAPDAALLAESCVKSLGALGIRAERLAPEAEVDNAPGKPVRDEAAALISKYGDRIEAVICGDSASALAAIAAFKAAGYFRLRKTVPIVGLCEGELPSALAAALSEGTLLGVASGDSESQGKAVFDLAYALAKGTDPAKGGWSITDAKYVWIPYKRITRGAVAAARK